jgi:small subunit ribosomal protein S20
MANTKGARKAARQSEKRRTHNTSLRSTLRTAITRVKKAIEAGDKAKAAQVYRESVSVLDRITDKKIMHNNKESRLKSRLNAQIKCLA